MNITDNVVRTATEALCASFACSPEAVSIDRATGNTTINGKPVGRLVIRGTEPGAVPIGDRGETARAFSRLLSGGPDEIMSLIGRIAKGKRGVTTSPATGWDVGTYFTVLGITPTGFSVRRDDGVEGVIDPTLMRAVRTGDPADPINRKTVRVRISKQQNSEWWGEYDAVRRDDLAPGFIQIQHPTHGTGTFPTGGYDVIDEAFETRPTEFGAQDTLEAAAERHPPTIATAAVGFSALPALPVMWLWNGVATDVLAVPQVTFLQAWGLSLLAGPLFGKRS